MTVQTGLKTVESTGAPPPARVPDWGRRLTPCLLVLVAAETIALGALGWYLHHERVVWSQRIAYLHASLGKEKENAGDLTAALSEYGAAVKLYPDNAKAWYVFGRALRKGNPQLGVRELKRAAELAPADAALLRDYGEALVDNAKLDEARAVLTKTVALKPDDAPAHVALGRAYLGHIASPQDLDRGLAALREALRLQPGEVQARFRLARALFQAGRLSEAQQEFGTTLSLLGDGARQSAEPMDGGTGSSSTWLSLVKGCHHYLSEIAYRQGRREEAQRERQLFDSIGAYIRESYDPVRRRNAHPTDPAVQRELAGLFARYGLPPEGPNGAKAAARWVDPSIRATGRN